MARWAIGKQIVRDFLQDVFGMAAGAAFVSVNRHGRRLVKPSIIGRRLISSPRELVVTGVRVVDKLGR